MNDSLHPPETTSSQEPQHLLKGKPRPAQLVIITSDSPVISLGVKNQTKTKQNKKQGEQQSSIQTGGVLQQEQVILKSVFLDL